MRRYLLIVILSFLAAPEILAGQSSPSQMEIRVRLLNYKNGRALKGHRVILAFSDPERKPVREEVVSSKTDSNGVAVFKLHPAPPPRIFVVLPDDYDCAANKILSTVEVLQHGVTSGFVDDPYCRPHVYSLPNAKPGEVTYVAHRLNLFQQFLRALD
jgi:hypothetical protein